MLVILLITCVFVLVVEKKSISVSIVRNPVRNTTFGLMLVFIWLGILILSLVFIGRINLGEKNNITNLWIWFIMVMFNVVMQEYLVRGYLFSLIKRDFNTAISILITTIIFTAMHGGAFESGTITILNIIVMSVFVSLLLIYSGSLFASIIAHFLWYGIGGPCLWHSISGWRLSKPME